MDDSVEASPATSSSAGGAPAQVRPPGQRPPRAERSCDTCRRRKLRCVREKEQERCVLCSFHQRECTYLDEPQQRRQRRKREDTTCEAMTNTSNNSISGANGRKRRKAAAPGRTAQPRSSTAGGGYSGDPGMARLSLTLGLHPTTHFKYIGPGSLHEDVLLNFIEPFFRYHNETDATKFCRVDEGTTFLARPDSTTPFSADDDDDGEAVERLVRPYGPDLVDLYFRIVHPSYPILHKRLFLERYRRGCGRGSNNSSSSSSTLYRSIPAPLLAAVYLLALDWWDYDQDLDTTAATKKTRPDGEALAKVATRALAAVVQRPKLSTVQACLLLLQRGGGAATSTAGGDSWVLTSQLVAVAEELGLHVDCTAWKIPAWEKGLRRRLAWATFMQDKWSSLIYGRPSHVQSSHWRIPPLSLDDFSEAMYDGDHGGATGRWASDLDNGGTEEEEDDCTDDQESDRAEADKGHLLFINLARLTEVMAEALATFYSHDPERYRAFSEADGMHTIELVKSVALRLRAWATALPSRLRMEAVRPRKLCSNGYLHLSYFVAEIMIYRCIVRSLARHSMPMPMPGSAAAAAVDTVQHSPALISICREAAKTRLLHVMRFVEALRPEHLQAFWWFASAKSLTYIRTYVSLLWATSSGEQEAAYYRQKLDEFRWSLRVRARGVAFVTAALREMGDTLEDIDMSRPPFEQLDQQKRQRLQSSWSLGAAAGQAMLAAPGGQALQTVQAASLPSTLGDGDALQDDENDEDATESLEGMVLQTTPEFLSDFGVSASEAFFADVNSLHLYTLDTQ